MLFSARPEPEAIFKHWTRHLRSWVLDGVSALRAIIFYSWINIGLVFVPLAIVSYFTHMTEILVFSANLVAIIPLSSLLSLATESVARESSDVVGALVNVTFGNLVEILIFFVALKHNQLEIVQTSLLGSILVNLLLILGLAILAGSFRRHDLDHNRQDAQHLASLLSFAVLSLLVPNAFYHSFEDADSAEKAVLTLSRVSAFTLLPIYLIYIVIQIRNLGRNQAGDLEISATTGSDNYDLLTIPRSIRFEDEEGAVGDVMIDDSRDSLEMSAFDGSEVEEHRINKDHTTRKSIYQHPRQHPRSNSRNSHHRFISPSRSNQGNRRSSFAGSSTSLPRLLLGNSSISFETERVVAKPELAQPVLGRTAAILLLLVSSAFVAACAEFLVDTLDDMIEAGPFCQTFIGLIVLPIVGNFAELFTAIYASYNGNFDLAIHVSVGSSTQISLLVTPLVVIAGWIMHREMSMYFDLFGTVALFSSTFLVNVLILYGKSNFLEGSLLIACYFIISVGAYLFPSAEKQS
jgi:Ca2+:H+ antiporter